MKTLKIYQRNMTERTRFKNYRFKAITEYVVVYGGEVKYFNNGNFLENTKIRVQPTLKLETRSIKNLEKFIANLSRCNDDKWLKEMLIRLLNEIK